MGMVVLTLTSVSMATLQTFCFGVGLQNQASRPSQVPCDSSRNTFAGTNSQGAPGCLCTPYGIQTTSGAICQSAAASGVCGPSGACQETEACGGQAQIISPVITGQTQGVAGEMTQGLGRVGGYTATGATQMGNAGQTQTIMTPWNSLHQDQGVGAIQTGMAAGTPCSTATIGTSAAGGMGQVQGFCNIQAIPVVPISW